MSLIAGKAYTFGNNIDTDQIYPGRYLELSEPEEIARHVMEGADSSFPERYQAGGIIVGGTNFGCGSSREHAVIALKTAGVKALIAESFARIFFRNCINLGLPLVICPEITQHVEEGDKLEVNLETGTVNNTSKDRKIQGEELSEFVLNFIKAGGVKPYYKEKNL